MLLTLIIFVTAGLSSGYVPLREIDGKIVRWDLNADGQPNVVNGKITWYMDPSGTIDVPTGRDEWYAVKASFDTWEDVETSSVAFLEDKSRTTFEQSTQDRINLIQWRSNYLPPGTLALTFPYSTSGVMTDVDIILNDDVDWDTSETGQDFVADVQAVLTHEIGHMIGLDHSPLGGTTMYPELPMGSIRSRSLESDDIIGITAIYPEKPDADYLGNIRGRVSVKGKGDGRGVLVVAMNLVTRMPEASAVSVEGGLYLLERLLPGRYRVYAFPLSGKEGMTPYWLESSGDFIGRIYGADGPGPDRAELVEVRYGSTTFGVDFENLVPDDEVGSSNGRPADAVPMQVQDSVIGVASTVLEEDWFRLSGSAGDTISVHVDAFHVGGDTNVQVDLYEAGMVTEDGVDMSSGSEPSHPRSVDIRPPIYEENRLSIDGVDTDARLEDITLSEDGYYFIRVTFSPNSNSGTALNYYLLTVYRDSEAPDEVMSEFSIWPPTIPADGAWNSVVTITPRNFEGKMLEAAVQVEVTGEGQGTLGEPDLQADGSFKLIVTAPTEPGEETFSIRMKTSTGSVLVDDALSLRYLGPPDPEQSDFRALPGRIDSDGKASSTLSLKVRDESGTTYGPGLPVSFRFRDEPDGQLGSIRDEGDGEYTCEVIAAPSDAVDEFEATFDGQDFGATTFVRYGFLLAQVIEDALAEITRLELDEGISESARAHLDRTRDWVDAAKTLLASGDARDASRALVRLGKAARSFQKALKKLPGEAGPVDFEFAEAGQRYTRKVIQETPVPDASAASQKIVTRAWRSHDRGARHHVKGAYNKALRKYARALKVIGGL